MGWTTERREWRRRWLRRRALAVAILAVAALPTAATFGWAQPAHPGPGGFRPEVGASAPGSGRDASGEMTVLAVNATLGALTAGVRRHARGGSFWRGFAEGAAGGALVYGGKWLSAEHFWGAGLLGRQVGTVGASVVRNSSEERTPFAELMFAAGPARLYLEPGAGWRPRAKLDLLATAMLTYRTVSSETNFEPGASLSAGTPVFMTQNARQAGWHGSAAAGVIVLLDEDASAHQASTTPEMVFAHERVHLLQYDQAQHTWGAPAEGWLLRRLPGGRWLERHVELGLVMLPVVLLNQLIDYDDRPWEREAHFFSGSSDHRFSGPRLQR